MLLTDKRRGVPWTLPPKPGGRSLYPFHSSLPWGKEARALQLLSGDSGKTPALCCPCRHTNLNKTCSHPSSKETMQRHLNHPQIPVAGEQCSINEAAPMAMRTLLSSSAIKKNTRFPLNAESNPFTWRTQPVSVDLWKGSFSTPCDSKVWHGDGAVHC